MGKPDKLKKLFNIKPMFLKLREKNDLTVSALARDFIKIGNLEGQMTPEAMRQRIYDAENGTFNENMLWLYCKRFNVSADALLGFSGIDVTEKNDKLLSAAAVLGISLELAQQIKDLDTEERDVLERLAKSGLLVELFNDLHQYAYDSNFAKVSVKYYDSKKQSNYSGTKAQIFLQNTFKEHLIGVLLPEIGKLYASDVITALRTKKRELNKELSKIRRERKP